MRFELVEEKATKFWEVKLAGTVLTQRWGKVGGSTNERVAELASTEAAEKQRDKMVREKTGLGYIEVGGKKVATKVATKKVAKKIEPTEKPAPAFSPSDLVITQIAEPGRRGRLSRLALDGTRVLAGGDRVVASSDGKKFWPRANPGTIWALHAIDGAHYACGYQFFISRDLGESWTDVGLPYAEYFSIHRDSKGIWWLGCGDGQVMTSKQPNKGWKKAFKGKGKMLWFHEADGKLFCASPDPGVWDGKTYSRLKGMKKSDVLTRITESPDGTLIAIGDGAIAYRSTDRGKSWQAVKTGAKKEDLEDCAWVAGALYVVGGAGTLLVSTNDGKSFKKIAVPDVTYQKLWGIASWGDGAFIGGDAGVLLKLAAPKDPYWKGAKDELAPPPAVIDPDFVPAPAASRDAEWKKLQAAATKAYSPTKDTRAKDPNPELAKLVDAEADETAHALDVYADWLQGQGDPRGELAAIQLKRAEDPKDKALAKAEKALFKTHAEALLGPFAKLSDVVTCEWRGGFIQSARVASTYERDPDMDGEKDEVEIDDIVIELLDHPSARFLRELTVGIVTFIDNEYTKIVKEIGKRHLPALRKLYLGDFSSDETEVSWSDLGNVQPIYAALPNLRSLMLRSGQMSLGKIVHPTLESFAVSTGGLDSKSAKAIATATWPNLRKLSISVGQDSYGGTTKLKDLKPILDGVGLPRLKHLGLCNLEYTDAAVDELARSKILPQIEELDLSDGTLSDDGVRRIFRYQKAFQHLKQIDVSNCFVSNAGLKLLRTLKVPIEAARQRDDEGDPSNRYAALGE